MRDSISISLPRHFNVDGTLSVLRNSSLRTPYHFTGDRRLGRIVHLDHGPGVLEFFFPQKLLQLQATLLETSTPRAKRPETHPLLSELRQITRFIWSLDDDLARCYTTLGHDLRLARLLRSNTGVRLVRAPSLHEALLVAVIGQQLSVFAAEAIRRRLIMATGDKVVVDGVEYRGYPTPKQLLAIGAHALRGAGISRAKVRYLREIAQLAAAGRLDRPTFDGLTDEDAIARLMEIPGVGRWTAEIALMRGLGRTDVFPAADLGLTVAAQRLMKMRARPSERKLRTLATRWKGWRSYAALHLWMTLAAAP